MKKDKISIYVKKCYEQMVRQSLEERPFLFHFLLNGILLDYYLSSYYKKWYF